MLVYSDEVELSELRVGANWRGKQARLEVFEVSLS